MPKAYHWDSSSRALKEWAAIPLAADGSDPSVIDIYDVIGEDPWSGGGFTEKVLAGILRKRGPNPVTVNINSPGGDMFEGLAIYNRLMAHDAGVTVNVNGIAASAASIIAMAGDTINMRTGTLMMIHNAWGAVVGNRHDFVEAAEVFSKFDQSMLDVYVKRTGLAGDDISAMMDGETFMTATEAVEKGFADKETEALDNKGANAKQLPESVMAKRRIEAALAADGTTRRERYALLSQVSGVSDSAKPIVSDSGEKLSASLRDLLLTMKCKGQ